jgi:hypothetical protein
MIPDRYHRHLHIAILILGFVVCGLASLYLGQDNNWDLRNYHYYNPHAFLTDRIGFDIAPAQRQSYLNPLIDLPYYVGINYLNPKLLGFLKGGIHGINLVLVFAICFLVFRNFSPKLRWGLSMLCSGLGLYGPVFIGEIGASQNDTLINLFVFASVYMFVRTLVAHGTLAGRGSHKTLITASLIFGLGVGLKLTAMIYALGAGAALLVAEQTWRKRTMVLSLWCLAFLVGLLITSGYWMAVLWQQFGNPVFPFYNHIFESPWAEVRSYADVRWLPQSLWEGLTRPFAMIYASEYNQNQNGYRDFRYAAIFVLLILLAVTWIYRKIGVFSRKTARRSNKAGLLPIQNLPVAERFLLVFFVVSFIVWEVKFSTIRYTAGLEALAPMLIVVLTCSLVRSGAVRTAIIAALLVSTAIVVRPIQHLRSPWKDSFWEVQLPTVKDPANSIIILANYRPWAYFIPLFPPEIRWLSVNSNLTRPAQPTKMQAEIRRILAEHQGDIYLLSRSDPSPWFNHDIQVLRAYGLVLQAYLGEPIVSPYSEPGLQLWPLRRDSERK